MDEEAGCFSVPARTEAAPLLVTAGEIDLARVLDRQNTPSHALSRSPSRQRLDDPIDRDVVRGQKSVNGLLAGSRLPQLPQDQRACCRHPFDQPVSPLRNSNIAK